MHVLRSHSYSDLSFINNFIDAIEAYQTYSYLIAIFERSKHDAARLDSLSTLQIAELFRRLIEEASYIIHVILRQQGVVDNSFFRLSTALREMLQAVTCQQEEHEIADVEVISALEELKSRIKSFLRGIRQGVTEKLYPQAVGVEAAL